MALLLKIKLHTVPKHLRKENYLRKKSAKSTVHEPLERAYLTRYVEYDLAMVSLPWTDGWVVLRGLLRYR